MTEFIKSIFESDKNPWKNCQYFENAREYLKENFPDFGDYRKHVTYKRDETKELKELKENYIRDLVIKALNSEHNFFSFLSREERDCIQRFNQCASPTNIIHTELPPQPYIGKPNAPIWVLTLNPGFSPLDFKSLILDESAPKRLEAIQKNLTDPYMSDFYLLQQLFKLGNEELGAFNWYKKHFQLLPRKEKNNEKLLYERTSNYIFQLEYFPYHSEKFELGSIDKKFGNKPFFQRHLSFWKSLVKAAIENEKILVIKNSLISKARETLDEDGSKDGRKKWEEAAKADRLFTFSSTQSMYLAKNNLVKIYFDPCATYEWLTDDGLNTDLLRGK